MSNRYYRCGACKRVLRSSNHMGAPVCCGQDTKRITDREARQFIEGRPFKGGKLRSLTGIIANRAAWQKKNTH